MIPWLEQPGQFLASASSLEQASLALLGVPLEQTVSFRPGTRLGPQEIRTASQGLEEYSLALGREIGSRLFYDCGDIVLPLGNREESLDRIREVVGALLERSKIPFLLGGEHLLTLPTVEAMLLKYPGLKVIQLDAHADLRQDYLGESLSHASVMRRVVDKLGAANLYQLGIRSATREEECFAREHTHFFPDQVGDAWPEVLADIGNAPIYLTLDIDVVDPAYAPGTGTPEPGGCQVRELLEVVRSLPARQVVGLDLVEVCPPQDPSGCTALLAAKLVREALLTIASRWE